MIARWSFISLSAMMAACAEVPNDTHFVDLSSAAVAEPAPPVASAPVGQDEPKPRRRVNRRVEPGQRIDAVTVFPYEENRIFQIVTHPGYITALHLEPGEVMPGKAAIGNPDPADWIVEKTTSGGGAGARVIVLVKPGRAGIGTNLVLATNRRVYQLDVRSAEKRGMDIVRWSYPATSAPGPETIVMDAGAGFDPDVFARTAYVIEVESGEKPKWMPRAVYYTGSKTYVEFPAGIGQVSAPALFALSKDGKAVAVPFRVRGRFYEVDTQLTQAELRQGETVVKVRSAG